MSLTCAPISPMPHAPERGHLPLVSTRPLRVVEFCDAAMDGAAMDGHAGSVMLLGNFDGFHRGHRVLLDAAREVAMGAPLSVMSAEPHPRQFFAPGGSPFRLTTARIKRDIFARSGFAFVFAPRFDEAFASQSAEGFVDDVLVRRLKIAHLVVGEDFRFGCGRRGDLRLLRAMGEELGFGVTEVAPVRQQELVCSSSLVREMLKAGDVNSANALLAEPWSVEAAVAHQGHGRLGLDWPADVLRLPDGHYRAQLRAMEGRQALHSGEVVLDGTRTFFRPDVPDTPVQTGAVMALDFTEQ